MMAAGKLVLDPECMARFTRISDGVYRVFGFDRGANLNPSKKAVPQGYFVELSVHAFRRIDGLWIVLDDNLTEIVSLCQDFCEAGNPLSFDELLLEFEAKDVAGLYGIGVLGQRFLPNGDRNVVERNRCIYRGLILHEVYAGEPLRHLKTYWSEFRYRVRTNTRNSLRLAGRDGGSVRSIVRAMKDSELMEFARLVVNGDIQLLRPDNSPL